MKTTSSEVTKDKLLDDFNNVLVETEQLLASVSSAGSDKAGVLKASVEQGLADASARLAKIREATMAQATAAADAADAYVQESPWRAVGMAAALAGAIGVIAGLLISRR